MIPGKISVGRRLPCQFEAEAGAPGLIGDPPRSVLRRTAYLSGSPVDAVAAEGRGVPGYIQAASMLVSVKGGL